MSEGALRETVAALQNLSQLLRSPLIGERALAPVFQEISESLPARYSEIVETLGGEGGARRSPGPLAFLLELERHFDAVGAMLKAHAGRLDARGRISAERALDSLASESEALLFHLGLLTLSSVPAVPLALGEILRTRERRLKDGAKSRQAWLVLGDPSFAWTVSARTFRTALSALVAALDLAEPELTLSLTGDGGELILGERVGPPGGEPIALERVHSLPCTLPVCAFALGRYAIGLSGEGRRLSFAGPVPPPPRAG